MGRLYESLQRLPERPNTWSAVPPSLESAPALSVLDSGNLPTLANWQPWFAEPDVPTIEVPDAPVGPVNAEASNPAIVPFPAHNAVAKPRWQWQPVPAPELDETYRAVAGSLLDELRGREAQSLLLLPLEDAGRMAEVAAELAGACQTLLRDRVLLVDTLRGPEAVAQRLGTNEAPGWEELLMGCEVSTVLQRSRLAGVNVIAAGNRLASVSSSVWSKEAGRRLSLMKNHCRLLLVTSPPWPTSPLGLVLAAEVAATCVVLAPEAVNGPLHQQLLHLLQADGRGVVGAIATS